MQLYQLKIVINNIVLIKLIYYSFAKTHRNFCILLKQSVRRKVDY